MVRLARPLDPPPATKCRNLHCLMPPTHRIASECVDHGRMTEDYCRRHLLEVMEAKAAHVFVCGDPDIHMPGKDCDKELRLSEPIELPTPRKSDG